MVYRAIGLMSGSSLDGLDIVFAELHENGGIWNYEILEADCLPYDESWKNKLAGAVGLGAKDYQLLHTAYGHYLGQRLNDFIEAHKLTYKVSLIASHGHTTFHEPGKKMTAQLGDGAAIAALTQLPVVSDLRAMDVALGGQGAPIVPIGEKLLLSDYSLFLNLGGIANVSVNGPKRYIAFDICAANRVLNMLAEKEGKIYDNEGEMAASGKINNQLLDELNQQDYYTRSFPKSLPNDFGTDVIYPIIDKTRISTIDALCTYVEHIAMQTRLSLVNVMNDQSLGSHQLLCTGGGALNKFLMQRIATQLSDLKIDPVIPDNKLVNYKEALIMALIGILRWRQENNVLASVTGAERDSIGGAIWGG